jgi:hypothetical protein
MPPTTGQPSRCRGSRTALRTASPAVEIIARRLLNAKSKKSIVPVELLSRSQKKKRESGGRASILSPSGIPKRNIEDSIKKLNKVAGRIGYYTIKQESGESYDNLQARWSNFRKTVKQCTSVDDICDRLIGIAMRMDERFLRCEWKNESKEQWMTSCRNAKSNPEIQACLREFENEGVFWEKVEYVHELMDISNQIPTSQVKNTDPKFWFEEFPSKLRDTTGPQEMAKHLKEICLQLRPGAEIVDKDWMQEKKSEWLRQCTACDSWPEFRQLMTSFDDDAVDWKNASKIMRRENESKEKDSKEDPKSESSKQTQSSKGRKSTDDASTVPSSNRVAGEKSEKRKIVKSKSRPSKAGTEGKDSGEDHRSSEDDAALQDSNHLAQTAIEPDKSKVSHKKRSKNNDEDGQTERKKKAKKGDAETNKDKATRSEANDSVSVENSREENSSTQPSLPSTAEVSSLPPPAPVDAVQDPLGRNDESTSEIATNTSSVENNRMGRCSPTAAAETTSMNSAKCSSATAETSKKPKVPKNPSKVNSSKAKPVKVAGAVLPRTGLGEHIDSDGSSSVRGPGEGVEHAVSSSIGSVSSSQANATLFNGQNGGLGVWDGAGNIGLPLRNDVGSSGGALGGQFGGNLGMHHRGGGQGAGGLRSMTESGHGQMAGLTYDADSRGMGLQRAAGVAGFMDALDLSLDSQGFRCAGPGMMGHSSGVGAGMLLQGVGLQAAAAQMQGNGRGYQSMGLGMQQQGNRVGFGIQQDVFNMSNLSDAGAFGWGGQGWSYLGQAAANMRLMQPYEDAAAMANMRMLQQLQSAASLVSCVFPSTRENFQSWRDVCLISIVTVMLNLDGNGVKSGTIVLVRSSLTEVADSADCGGAADSARYRATAWQMGAAWARASG